jgi:hypothetical protein
MPRNRTRIQRSKSAPVKRENNNTPIGTNANSTVSSTVSSTVGSTIAQGVSLGAGAAIGSTIAHSAMDLFTSTKPVENTTNNNNYCNELMEQFKQCSLNNSELNNCKPYLDLYNQCIKNNNL